LPIPSFSWSDAPAGVPPGNPANVVTLDRDGKPRARNDTAGAYVFGTATLPSRRRAAPH